MTARMDDNLAEEQAEAIAELLPAIMRRLFAGDGDPVSELPLAQLRVCAMLRQGARSMSAMSRELRVSLSALTQIADRLERAGLVQRVAEPNDRRIRCLQLTDSGEERMRRQVRYRSERVLAVLGRLDPEERLGIRAALDRLSEACHGIKRRDAAVLQQECD